MTPPLVAMRVATQPDEEVPAMAPPPLGFTVLDPQGIPIGFLSGWIDDRRGHPQFLVITLYQWNGDVQVCLPLGAVLAVNERQRRIRLQEATRATLVARCIQLSDMPPSPTDLADTLAFFPNPRPSITEHIASMCRTAERTMVDRWARFHAFANAKPAWQNLAMLGQTG